MQPTTLLDIHMQSCKKHRWTIQSFFQLYKYKVTHIPKVHWKHFLFYYSMQLTAWQFLAFCSCQSVKLLIFCSTTSSVFSRMKHLFLIFPQNKVAHGLQSIITSILVTQKSKKSSWKETVPVPLSPLATHLLTHLLNVCVPFWDNI